MNRLIRLPGALLTILFAVIAIQAHSQQFIQRCADPNFPTPTATVADGSCQAQGNGGEERVQNLTKNDFCAPTPGKAISFPSLDARQKNVEQDGTINFGDPPSANPGPTTDRTKLRKLGGEGSLVSLIGYVLIARQEGKESVNCGSNVPNSADYHDIHISIVQVRRQQDECQSAVVEMSPHHRPPEWTAANVNKLARLNVPVRVIGQLFFDSSHVPCANGQRVRTNPKRFSLWEIHPIYKFQVCTANCNTHNWQWTDFSDWVRTNGNTHGN